MNYDKDLIEKIIMDTIDVIWELEQIARGNPASLAKESERLVVARDDLINIVAKVA